MYRGSILKWIRYFLNSFYNVHVDRIDEIQECRRSTKLKTSNMLITCNITIPFSEVYFKTSFRRTRLCSLVLWWILNWNVLSRNIFRTFVYFDLWWFLRLECEVTLEWGTNFMFLFVLFVEAQQSNLVK